MAAEVTFDKGLNLRIARHLAPAGTMLNAMNLAPDEMGIVSTRKGMVPVGVITGQDMTSYYKLFSPVTHTYQGVVNSVAQLSLVRDFTTTLIGPVGTAGYVDFCDMREYQNDRSWVFFAAGQAGFRFKDDGTFTYGWGIHAPSAAPTVNTGGSGNLNGTYTYRYIFVRHDLTGQIPVNWGNPSPISAPIVATNQQVVLTDIKIPGVAGPDFDLQVTHVYIFRNQASNPDIWLLAGIMTAISDTFTDVAADVDLPIPSGLASGLLEFDNGIPPVFASVTVHQERVWGVTGQDNRVYYSKAQRPEQFSATGYLELGPLTDTATVVKSFDGRLYVGTDTRLIPILGTDETSYIPDNTPLPIGVVSPFTMAQGLKGLYWRGPDGIYVWNGAAAQNITDAALYPIFHNQVVDGFLPAIFGGHPQGVHYFAAGGWFQGRYYISLPIDPNDLKVTETFVYDEMTETWYADHRQFRRFFYARQDEALIGTTRDGIAYQLATGTLDSGNPIPWTFQSRDIVEGEPNADQSLEEVTLEFDSQGSAVTLTMVKDFGSSLSASVITASNGRTQQILAMQDYSIVAKALGYRLSGTGTFKLYRIMPRLLTYPATRLALDTLTTDLGYPGQKRIVGFTLDTEILEPGLLTATLLGDNLPQAAFQQTAVARTQSEVLTQAFDATLIRTSIRSTGRWRLYPSTMIAWIPLPLSHFVESLLPSDLGYAGPKRLSGVWLDTELLSPGTLTPTLLTDTTTVPLIPQTTVGRRDQDLLAAPVDATLVGLDLTSTAPFRLWSKSFLAWVPLPPEYLTYDWPASSLGTADEKMLQAVSLDLEIRGSGTVVLAVVIDASLTITFPLVGNGRHTTARLRFPKTAHGRLIEYAIQGTTYWRLWGGEFLFTRLGSREGFQRFPIATSPGSQGPEVQRTPIGASAGADAGIQHTSLASLVA